MIFWVDVTYKVHADNEETARAIITDAAYQGATIYEGELRVKEISELERA